MEALLILTTFFLLLSQNVRANINAIPKPFDNQILDDPDHFEKVLEARFREDYRSKKTEEWWKSLWEWQHVLNRPGSKVTKSPESDLLRLAMTKAEQQSDKEALFDLKRLQIKVLREDTPGEELRRDYENLLADPELSQWPEIKALTLMNLAETYTSDSEYPLRNKAEQNIFRWIETQKPVLPMYIQVRVLGLQADILYDEHLNEKALQLDLALVALCDTYAWRYTCISHYTNAALSLLRISPEHNQDIVSQLLHKAEVLYEKLPYPAKKSEILYAKFEKAMFEENLNEMEQLANEILSMPLSDAGEGNQRNTRNFMASKLMEKNQFTRAWSYLEPNFEPMNKAQIYELTLGYKILKSSSRFEEALHFHELVLEKIEDEQKIRKEADYERIKAEVGLASEEQRSQFLTQDLSNQKKIEKFLWIMLSLSLGLLGLGVAFIQQLLKIKSAKRKIDAMLKNIQLGIVMLNQKGEIEGQVSLFIAYLLEHECSGKNFWELLNAKLPKEVSQDMRDKVMACIGLSRLAWQDAHRSLPETLEIAHSEGLKTLACTWQAIWNHRQQVRHVLLILRDITQERQLKEDLEIRNERLINLGFVTATIAHDIASPSQIIGIAQDEIQGILKEIHDSLRAIFEEQTDQEAQVFWHHIEARLQEGGEACRRATTAIKRITSIQSAIRNQSRSDESMTHFQLKPLLEESLMLGNPYVRQLRLQIHCPDTLGVFGFRTQIGQVLTNICNNAADAVEENKSTANHRAHDLIIEVMTLDGEIQISIEDAGAGIPEDKRSKIFESFYTTKPVGKGTGLGLPICLKVMKNHGGQLYLGTSSRLGGAQFILKLPLTQ